MANAIDYGRYLYFPLIRVRQAEMQGVEMLSDPVKEETLPLLTLGKWRNTEGVDKGIERIEKALEGRPYMLDLSKDNAHQNSFVVSLLNPERNFKAWSDFVGTHEHVLPVVQITDNATTRNVVRQALALEDAGRQPVFRIRDYKNDTDAAVAALTAMDSPETSLVVIDAGYLRELSTLRIKPGIVQSVLRSITQINNEVDTQIVVAGTSYPRAVTDFLADGDTRSGRIDMIEWDLFGELSDYVLYGDHAGVHSVVYDDAGGTFLPKLDYPKDGFWYFERRPDIRNAEGFVAAARALVDRFPEIAADPCWGARMIMQTATQDGGATINSPSTALAVRVNLHISSQAVRMQEYYREPDDEDREWTD
jgi:hypothetical protein